MLVFRTEPIRGNVLNKPHAKMSNGDTIRESRKLDMSVQVSQPYRTTAVGLKPDGLWRVLGINLFDLITWLGFRFHYQKANVFPRMSYSVCLLYLDCYITLAMKKMFNGHRENSRDVLQKIFLYNKDGEISVRLVPEALTHKLGEEDREFQSRGTATVKEDEYEDVRWEGMDNIEEYCDRVSRL
ncbi:hypothetical protein ANN_01511 [Periplaneta americana]|uniref:Uncharacterized protein n=1 Tax=Periplaneta americana TaxID=6978 RepID=A0ABQ8TTU8_PERAM|nr:hypothetical protein ANN_01511 [Periplaneta americana]